MIKYIHWPFSISKRRTKKKKRKEKKGEKKTMCRLQDEAAQKISQTS